MTKVHCYVHGRGRGHGRRVRSVVEHLETRGYSARIFAGPGALGAFEVGRAERVDSLMPGQGFATLSTLRARVTEARAALRADPPRALISDGD